MEDTKKTITFEQICELYINNECQLRFDDFKKSFETEGWKIV